MGSNGYADCGNGPRRAPVLPPWTYDTEGGGDRPAPPHDRQHPATVRGRTPHPPHCPRNRRCSRVPTHQGPSELRPIQPTP
eukprot:14275748-Alexandrium_andersonii.AAC.1